MKYRLKCSQKQRSNISNENQKSKCTKCIINKECYSKSNMLSSLSKCPQLLPIEGQKLLSCLQSKGPIVMIGDSRLRFLYEEMFKVLDFNTDVQNSRWLNYFCKVHRIVNILNFI